MQLLAQRMGKRVDEPRGNQPLQPGTTMQQRKSMINQLMQVRIQMQKRLEEKLQVVEESSGKARVDAIVELLRTVVQKRGRILRKMQGMHQKMQGRRMMDRGQMMMGPGMMDPGMPRRQRMHRPSDETRKR